MRRLDSCARLRLGRRGRVGSYFGMGLIGGVAGLAVGVALGVRAQVPVATLVIAAVAPWIAFLVAIKVEHILFGYERIVLYEKLAAAFGVSALGLHLAGEPVRPGLELVTLGAGTFLVFGRLGCLRVGCCHGRPHRTGIAYGEEHGRAGFPVYLVGVRLFPVQLAESLATLLLVVMAGVMFAFPHVPGQVLAYYVSMYAGIRFTLELIRGDDDRPIALGLSEAQWIALGSAWLMVWAARAWKLNLGAFHWSMAIGLTAGALAVAVAARREGWRLEQPRALRELGEALLRLRGRGGRKLVTDETRGGLKLSFSIEDGVEHYGVSPLSERAARRVARQIQRLRNAPGEPEVLAGRREGLWHVRLRLAPEARSPGLDARIS